MTRDRGIKPQSTNDVIYMYLQAAFNGPEVGISSIYSDFMIHGKQLQGRHICTR